RRFRLDRLSLRSLSSYRVVVHHVRRTPAKSEVHAKARVFARNGENGRRRVRVNLRMPIPNRELLQLPTYRFLHEPECFDCRNRCERDKVPLLSPVCVMTTTIDSHAVSG